MFSKRNTKPYVLAILDGWGMGPIWGGNAIALAKTPFFSDIYRKYPATLLQASGKYVGLPEGSPGNSESGHLTIGAGYMVPQDQPFIDRQIEDESFFSNKVLMESIEHVKKNRSTLHVLGLLAENSAHGSISHLFAILKFAKAQGLNKVSIHLFSDGRDSSPLSGIELVSKVEAKIKEIGVGEICSIIGRFYAMDRDNRYDRIAKAYHLLTKGHGEIHDNAISVFSKSYARNTTDEFIEPSIIASKGKSISKISDNDAVIFYNLRIDRTRLLIKTFLDKNFSGIQDHKLLKNIHFTTFAMYDEDNLAKHPFSPDKVDNPLCHIWALNKIKQFHITETEKYIHVTYYFNGATEKPNENEVWQMIPSPKNVKTYDQAPEMHASKIASTVVGKLKKQEFDAYVVNFPNPDMVGHTGNLKATIQAVEATDKYLKQIADEVLKQNGVLFVTADHGNAEQMVNPQTGSIDTEHTENPVPFIIISKDAQFSKVKLKNNKSLTSVAPTILDIMGIDYKKYNKDESLILRQDE